MGYEYKLKLDRLTVLEIAEIDIFLKSLSEFDSIYQNSSNSNAYNFNLYNFRLITNQESDYMPDAFAAIEKDGIYFCNNSSSKEIQNKIITWLRDRFSNLEILDDFY